MTDGSLTKAEFIEEVAHAAGLTRKRAEIIVNTAFGSIVETLHRGERVELRGFGSFRLRRRGPHRGRNPGPASGWTCRRDASPTSRPGKELLNREPAQAVPLASSDAGAGGGQAESDRA